MLLAITLGNDGCVLSGHCGTTYKICLQLVVAGEDFILILHDGFIDLLGSYVIALPFVLAIVC